MKAKLLAALTKEARLARDREDAGASIKEFDEIIKLCEIKAAEGSNYLSTKLSNKHTIKRLEAEGFVVCQSRYDDSRYIGW